MATTDDNWDSFWRYRDSSLPRRQREAAFTSLIDQNFAYVEDAAKKVLNEICDGKPPRGVDAAQIALEAFHVLGMKAEAVTTTPKSYIWGILRMLAHRQKDKAMKRADRRALSYDSLVAHPTGGDPDSVEAILDERQRVSEAIAKLSPRLQQVIDLHDFQALEFKEIDRLLGLKPGGARQRHCRARMKLAELLVRPFPATNAPEPSDSDEPTLD